MNSKKDTFTRIQGETVRSVAGVTGGKALGLRKLFAADRQAVIRDSIVYHMCNLPSAPVVGRS